jgi:hypothetical protein
MRDTFYVILCTFGDFFPMTQKKFGKSNANKPSLLSRLYFPAAQRQNKTRLESQFTVQREMI